MSSRKLVMSFLLQLLLCLLAFDSTNAEGLHKEFYKKTCRQAEDIVQNVTAKFISQDPRLAPALLRMHFHDCFVRGCDGSVLLNSTNTTQAEKEAAPNQTLKGFDVIDAIKSALEEACPNVVSCADTVALAARDAVTLINGTSWEVLTGRRDGTVSLASEALTNLPPPFANITELRTLFAKKGLSKKDLVVLSGAHTIGVSHCFSFSNRLYNFTGKGDSDPSMDPKYVAELKKKCKPNDTTTLVEMDPGSSTKFDSHYYVTVYDRRGLFQSDAALLNDKSTSSYVEREATGRATKFFKDFKASMEEMSRIGVLTGTDGQIRKNCAVVNK
ncbi:hypothetical protein Nepgr_014436 [Nepenthes gracilis]|uniref:Peroxidase n=1 Tax=Nepenthes gracilis TaxID=150966 RepID=A0AAD3SKS7_NEPGR|nr:hypothetical protein Nepgr_014436 [Nepenthes gracilis]